MADQPDEKKKGKHDSPYFAAIGQAAQVSVTLLANILVGLLLGRFLDHLFGTNPWLTVICLILGVLAGFWGTYKLITGKER